jgi:hypothetical protein
VPIKGRADDEISLRADFFSHIFDLMDQAASRRGRTLFYHTGHPLLLAHAYFALHDAFKSSYVKAGHLSDAAKRAAASCAAVIAVAPLHPNPNITREIDPATDDDVDYPNPFMAARCAAAFLPHPFQRKTWDARRRDYCGYTGLQFPSIDPIINEWKGNGGIVVSDWPPPVLNPNEEAVLCLLANGFQTAANFQTPQQENR